MRVATPCSRKTSLGKACRLQVTSRQFSRWEDLPKTTLVTPKFRVYNKKLSSFQSRLGPHDIAGHVLLDHDLVERGPRHPGHTVGT